MGGHEGRQGRRLRPSRDMKARRHPPRNETNPQQATMIKPAMAPLERMFSSSVLRCHKDRVHHLSDIYHFCASQGNKTEIEMERSTAKAQTRLISPTLATARWPPSTGTARAGVRLASIATDNRNYRGYVRYLSEVGISVMSPRHALQTG